MIEYRTGDLLKQTDLNYIVHGCNCQNTMGSGIALSIRNKWPQVYEADCKTIKGHSNKLGSFSGAFVTLDNGNPCFVYNLYQQYRYGRDMRHLDYGAFYDGMEGIKRGILTDLKASLIVVGIPYRIGCNLAGGSWSVVEAMLKDLFENELLIKLVICKIE